MEDSKLSRRQFLGGAAAVVGAAVLPAITSVAPAAATPTGTFATAATQLTPWIPLNPKAAARQGLEIYRGKHPGQGG